MNELITAQSALESTVQGLEHDKAQFISELADREKTLTESLDTLNVQREALKRMRERSNRTSEEVASMRDAFRAIGASLEELAATAQGHGTEGVRGEHEEDDPFNTATELHSQTEPGNAEPLEGSEIHESLSEEESQGSDAEFTSESDHEDGEESHLPPPPPVE